MFLRVIATVFVICVHTVALAKTTAAPGTLLFRVLEVFNYTFLSCNLFFVIISGALLLPVKGERCRGFCAPLYPCLPSHSWSITICMSVPKRESDGSLSVAVGTDAAAVLPSDRRWKRPHLWLVYVIISLYVLTPFLRYLRCRHIPDPVTDVRDACDLPSECVCHLCAAAWRYAAGGTLRYCEFVCGCISAWLLSGEPRRGGGRRIFSLRRVLCHISSPAM